MVLSERLFPHPVSMPSRALPRQPVAAAPDSQTSLRDGERLNVRFQGGTHLVRGRVHLTGEEFKQLLETQNTPYIGKLPRVLVHLPDTTPKQIYQALDELAPVLKALPDDLALRFTLKQSPTPITVRKVGNGCFGSVYRLTVQGQDFALKAYYRENLVYAHGPFAEMGTGLYLSNRPLKDVGRFHFGNPQAGWGVFEFIEPSAHIEQRPGRTLADLGLYHGDDKDENRINGIRVDYGGLSPVPLVHSMMDFQRAIRHPSPVVQMSAASQIWELPAEVRGRAFMMAWRTGDDRVRATAASQLESLPQVPMRERAFLLALKTGKPDIQARAVSRLGALGNRRLEGFKLAMRTKNVTVQAAAAARIATLPVPRRAEAFKQAIRVNHPVVRARAASQIYALHAPERLKAFAALWPLDDWVLRTTLLAQLAHMPDARRRQAYRQDYIAMLEADGRFAHVENLKLNTR